MNIAVQIKKLSHGADLPVPEYITEHAAGMDLAAAIDHTLTIEPGEIVLIPSGIAVALPPGYEFQIRPRSGLAVKHGLTVINSPGTIDADYRGEIKIGLINLGRVAVIIKRGQRIAQMVLAQTLRTAWIQVENLPASDRGDGGFGHSGV
ncbi:MAG TPA: dUTP diphosphatase [Thermodesulfobacteriaceae bacterium]|nr:dUTP diphosphatase [Thermodesulfobacteriaceae bacterium]